MVFWEHDPWWLTMTKPPLVQPDAGCSDNNAGDAGREKRHSGRLELSGEGLTALVTTRGDDGTASAGTHTGTEAVHASTATVVGLESTLALGHGTSLLQ